MFSTENLKVGDKVIVVHGSIYSDAVRDVGEVVKKTPKGKVDIKYCGGVPQRYSNDGSFTSHSKYPISNNYLEYWSEEAEREIRKQKLLSNMRRWLKAFDYDKLSYEECERVYKLVAGFRTT